MAELPAEERLGALAARFKDAERRVRELLRRAPTGDRRELLWQALAILLGLRHEAATSGEHVEHAYVVAAGAVVLLSGRPDSPIGERARDLGRSLAVQLDRAVRSAERGSREAFAAATEDNLADAEQEAVTGAVDRDGRRRPLGAHAAMLTATIGRHAVSRATADTLGQDATVTISSHANPNPLCVPFERDTFAPGERPLPPYHPSCQHIATPSGFTLDEHVQAMRAAATQTSPSRSLPSVKASLVPAALA